MKDIAKNNIYFLGIGGIGMSALARHFKNSGKNVAGYDKTPTRLTNALRDEGISIHFEDSLENIPGPFKEQNNTLVIYTPAIPSGHTEFNFFKNHGFEMVKRARTLGMLVNSKKGIAVAGTHGKTSTSTITAFILKQSKVGCSAFLGGISKNFNTNYIFNKNSNYIVAEADEFDRSFLHLSPHIAIVTAIDPDHLEIYTNKQNILESFNLFISQVDKNGYLILNEGIREKVEFPKGPTVYTYSLDNNKSDFYVIKKELINGLYTFVLQTPFGASPEMVLGIPGKVNLENTIAAIAASMLAGVTFEEIKATLPDLNGVIRRFDILLRSNEIIYMDDYAHHPEEIKRMLESVREMFPGKKITGIFQPHLFTRTRDFAADFAQSLSLLDNLIMLDIYPARELPIPGITSEIIFNQVRCAKKVLCNKQEVINILKNESIEILITIGAGDIDTLTGPIVEFLKEKKIEKV